MSGSKRTGTRSGSASVMASFVAKMLARSRGPLQTQVATIAAILLGALLLALLLEAGHGQPVLLGTMALLATTGTFGLLGWAAGYIRFAEHASDSVLMRTLVAETDTAMQVVARSGAPLFTNRAFHRLIGGVGSPTHATIARVIGGEPGAAEALYRLTRAAEFAEPHHEDVLVRARSLGPGVGATPTDDRWLRVAVRPLPTGAWHREHGPMVLWLATDVTAERVREAAQLSRMRDLAEHYETMPIGYLAFDRAGTITHVSKSLDRLLTGPAGNHGHRLPARAVLSDVMPLDMVSLVERTIATADCSKRVAITTLDVDLLRNDGTVLPVRLLLQLRVGDGVGEAGGDRVAGNVQALVLDRALEGNRSSGETVDGRFARLFRAAPFGVGLLGDDGRILEANAAFARMMPGATDVPVRRLQDMTTASDSEARKALETALCRALEAKASISPIDLALDEKGEVTRRVYLTGLGEADGAGAALVFVVDTSELRALEIKFTQSQKMEAIGKLAGGIAHDFNNVLTVILGVSDLLLRTRRPNDPGHGDLMDIKQNAERAAGMVRQLLAFSRKQTLAPAVLDLNEVVQDYSIMLDRLVGEVVDVKHLPGRELWYVKADRNQLEQVLMNLAVNARDAMSGGGKLTLRTDNLTERRSLELARHGMPAGEYVMLEVTDNGIGMTPEVVTKIFEPYFTTKELGKGTGLGLSTVYGIVKQTGGYIYADSEPGQGTTFRIYLPRHVPEPAAAPTVGKEAKRKDPPRDLTGSGCVLLVEDEDAVRAFSMRALKRQGFTVLTATNGLEALQMMAKHGSQIDLVVSDVMMPEMDGPTMLREMRKTKPDIKIVFVSGYPSDAFERSIDDGVSYGFLSKPYTLPDLAAKVKEVLGE